jgi:hypothetical protein
MARALKITIFALGVVMICRPIPSLSAGYSMDYSIGFNGYFQLNQWAPLSVVLDNRGRAARGKLEVVVTSGSEYHENVNRTVYTATVDLPQNSRKRYAFTILIESYTHALIIRLRQENDLIFSRSIDLRTYFTAKSFAVVADNFVAPDVLSVLPDHLFPVSVRPDVLPETWYGYDSVKLLILQADTIRQLRDRQFQALTQWVKQGGYLVVGTGLNYGALGDKRLQDILPLRIAGHQQLLELKSLGAFCGRELSGTEPFLVLKARIDNSKILVKENGIPIIAAKDLEFGRIIFLSFDFNAPPFSRWEGRRMLWNKILSLQPITDRPVIQVDDQQVVNTMLAGIPLKFPHYRSVVIFVAAYLIGLWFLLKKIRKPGKGRWQTGLYLIAMITAFTSIAYWGVYLPSLKQKFSYNSFYHIDAADPDAPATATYFIGLYSLKKFDYGVNFGAAAAAVSPVVSEKSNAKIPGPWELQTRDGGQQIAGSLKPWSHNFYKLRLNEALPLAGGAHGDKSAMSLTIENKLPHDLVDCLIYYRKRFLLVADILAGNRQTIKIDLATLKQKEIFGEHQVDSIARRFHINGSDPYLRAAQRNLTPQLLHEIHDKYQATSNRMILIGWVQGGLIQPQFNQAHPPGAGIALVNWGLAVETPL